MLEKLLQFAIFNQFLETKQLLEFENNPFLPEFYKLKEENKPIPSELAIDMEIWFVEKRSMQLRNALDLGLPIISDWDFSKCEFFGKTTIEGDVPFATFKAKLKEISQNFPKPDLYLYINCSVEQSKKRMLQRGREYEKNVPTTYLERLRDAYLASLHDKSHLVISNPRTNWHNHLKFIIEPLLR